MKKIVPISIGAALVVAVGAVGIAFAAAGQSAPESEPTVVSQTVAPKPVATPTPTLTPTPTPAPTTEAAVPAPEMVPVDVPAPEPEPVTCPGGSFAIGQDGPNDTLCLPNECEFNSGNPDFPQCDSPFRP